MIQKKYFVIYYILLIFLYSCTTSNNKNYKNEWLEYQYKSIEYIDTTNKDINLSNLFIDGLIFQLQDKHADAILSFQEALKYTDDNNIINVIYNEISKSYIKLNKFDIAIKYALKSIKLNQNFIPAYINLSEVYLENIDLQNAIFTLESIINVNDDIAIEEDILMGLAKIYHFQNINKSLKYYKQLKSKFNNQEAIFNILQIYKYKINDNLLYEKTIQKINLNNINNIYLIEEINNFYINNNQFDKLIQFCNLINNKLSYEELNKVYSNILELFTDTLITNNIPNNIKYDILKFIDYRLSPYLETNYYAGILALYIPDTSLADLYFKIALKYKDTTHNIPIQVANIYKKNNYINKYLEILETFNNKNISCIYPFYLGLHYYTTDKKQSEKALKYLKLAARYTDNNFNKYGSQIYNLMAEIYDNNNDIQNSTNYYIKALNLDSMNPQVINNYAYHLCKNNIDLEKALFYSKLAINIENNSPFLLDTYGWIQYKLGNYDEALKAVSKAIDLLSEYDPEIFEHIYYIYIKQKDFNNAEKIIERVLNSYPNDTIFLQKKEELKNIIN